MITLCATIVATDSFLLQMRNATIKIKLMETVAHPIAKLKQTTIAILLSKMCTLQVNA